MAQTHADAAVQLRRYDDLAKDVDAVTPAIDISEVCKLV